LTPSVNSFAGIFSSDGLTDDNVQRFLVTVPRLRSITAGLPNAQSSTTPVANSPRDGMDAAQSLPADISKFSPFSNFVDSLKREVGSERLTKECAKDNWSSVDDWAAVGNRIARSIVVIQRDDQLASLKVRQAALAQLSTQKSLTDLEKRELQGIANLLANMPKWKGDRSDIEFTRKNYPKIQRMLTGPP
jgi:predicted RNA-binding protein with RPS1 domain